MSIRVVLVPLFGGQEDLVALNAACHVARRFEGRLIGLFAAPAPADLVPFVAEGISAAAVEQLVQAAEQETSRRRDEAREHFRSACEAAGVPIVDDAEEAAGFAAHWTQAVGRREEVIPLRARVADITVFSRGSDLADLEQATIEATLFGAGRPVIVVPKGWTGSVGHRVAIAWNGSREAARALASAMPLLEPAISIHVLAAETGRTHFEMTHDVSAYLKLHGLKCERLAVQAEDGSAAAAILGQAQDLEVDLLVMGGYGRSRLAELVLGGVTRHVLSHAELPVLLDH
jgi:nucleotide-binding universal stress UspA family protein